MRLRRLDLTRYGRFTDYSIDFGEAKAGAPDMHIIYGLNEAGKSTAFSAYLDLIYGIDVQSPYNFLHAYNAMQIGADLEFDGTGHELVRTKGRSNTLLDTRGQPASEALLAAPLAGISRDSYRTMFSLDERSLREGGNAIIQSKGDLGELLFSASAGLADLSRTLSSVGDEANAIHKKRGRSTQLAELKQTLLALKAQRDEIDTFASAYATLTATHAQAETAYDAAMTELAAARTRHSGLNHILRALPLAAELARVRAELSGFADLAKPPAHWSGVLPRLIKDETRLQTQIGGTDEDILRLQAEIDAIAVDAPLLALAGRIAGLDDARARFRTAEDDLPKRRNTLIEQQALLAAILTSLEQPGHQTPETLLLPASLIGTFRDLIEAHSGIEAERQSAERELLRARDALQRANEAQARLGGAGEMPAASAVAAVETALSRLRQSDHQAGLRLEERRLAQLQSVYDTSIINLRPWTGDENALQGLPTAEPRQLETWRASAGAIEKRIGQHEERLRDLVSRKGEAEAAIAAIQASAGAIGDAEAGISRAERDAAWQAHLKSLDAATAKIFEDRMRADDAKADARLLRSRDLADLRQQTETASRMAAAVLREHELLDQVQAEREQLGTQIAAYAPKGIRPPGDARPDDWLVLLEIWFTRRREALTAHETLRKAEDTIATLSADAETDMALLKKALSAVGFDATDARSLADLVQGAADCLAELAGRRTTLLTAEKNADDRRQEVAERERALATATTAAERWHADWNAALAKTWFGTEAQTVAAVREILKTLTALPAALRERDEWTRRIVTMERDQEMLRAEIGDIFKTLGEPFDPARTLEAAETLTERAAIARRAHERRETKRAERLRLDDIRHKLAQELLAHEAEKAELTTFFKVATLGEVGTLMERAADKERLQTRQSTLTDQIAAEMRTSSFEQAEALLAAIDATEVEREAAELLARIEDQNERSKQLFADRTRARDRIEAVGGDGAVAEIEARRRTIFLEIEDLAQRYLRLKTGQMAAESALHIYRDKHRSSMMNRASDAFRAITRGEYSGLAAMPEKNHEVLIGVPKAGGSKLADDMSTGTQFQLYLALRLAGYREFALVRPSVPFIADDIMETFDEPRSEEVFRLFAEMATIGQVIYLTHHRHLCDIARDVLPGVHIHELNS
ncbi:MAG: AAA family ATPase [Allorhizobium sp.]